MKILSKLKSEHPTVDKVIASRPELTFPTIYYAVVIRMPDIIILRQLAIAEIFLNLKGE